MRVVPSFEPFEYRKLRFSRSFEPVSTQYFAFQRCKEAFGHRVVVGGADRSHRGHDAHFATAAFKGVAGVLASVVGVVNRDLVPWRQSVGPPSPPRVGLPGPPGWCTRSSAVVPRAIRRSASGAPPACNRPGCRARPPVRVDRRRTLRALGPTMNAMDQRRQPRILACPRRQRPIDPRVIPTP